MALALVLACAAPSPSSPSLPSADAVVVLPFLADGAVSVKQAHGVTALVRNALVDGQVAKVLDDSGDDDKQSQKCQRDLKCLGGIADLRGADLLLAGAVTPSADGLKISVVVVKPKGVDAFRKAEATLKGDAGDAARIDRLARTAINPASLVGAIHITGDEGATVFVDGALLGTLPLDDVVKDLPEGDHTVLVHKPGYSDLSRRVTVTYNETAEMHAVLLGGTAASPVLAASEEVSHTDAVVVGSIGGGLLVLGGVAGTLSLFTALDVESRAKAQTLAFPTDAALYQRGQIEAYTADGLYAGAAVAGAAAVILWLLDAPPSPRGAE